MAPEAAETAFPFGIAVNIELAGSSIPRSDEPVRDGRAFLGKVVPAVVFWSA
jgi:hypothetical protein